MKEQYLTFLKRKNLTEQQLSYEQFLQRIQRWQPVAPIKKL